MLANLPSSGVPAFSGRMVVAVTPAANPGCDFASHWYKKSTMVKMLAKCAKNAY